MGCEGSMKLSTKIIPIIGPILLMTVISGCVQVQRTDMLSAAEAAKVVEATSQLSQLVDSSLVIQIRACRHSKSCLARVAQTAQQQFAPTVKAYQHAANSVRGNCYDALQPIASALADVDQALTDMSTAAGSKTAAAQFTKALKKLPNNNSYLTKCSKQ